MRAIYPQTSRNQVPGARQKHDLTQARCNPPESRSCLSGSSPVLSDGHRRAPSGFGVTESGERASSTRSIGDFAPAAATAWSRWTSFWPLSPSRAPSAPVHAPRSRPPAGSGWPSPGAHPSPARSAGATSPAGQVPVFVLVSRCPRRLPWAAGDHVYPPPVNVSGAYPYGRLSDVHLWPLLGVHRGSPKCEDVHETVSMKATATLDS